MSGEEAGLGRAITERVRPRLTLADRRGRHARPGQLTRSTVSFGMRIGLSTQNRREYDNAIGADARTVRPPIDYWPWPDTGEQAVEIRRASAAVTPIAQPTAPSSAAPAGSANVRTKPVTAAEVKAWSKADELRRMLTGKGFASFDGLRAPDTTAPVRRSVATHAAGRPAGVSPETISGEPTSAASPASPASPAVTPARPVAVRRGLPLTPRRRGGTWAGPHTSPGGMATGAAPSTTASVAPPRHTTLAPEPLPDVARTGVVDTPSAAGSTSRPGTRATPAPTVSAAEMARRLLGEPAPAPLAAVPVREPAAEIPGPRPGGALGRALAAASADASTTTATASSDAAVRRAPSAARPSITADALRRTLAPTPAPTATSTPNPNPPVSPAPAAAPTEASMSAASPASGAAPGSALRRASDAGPQPTTTTASPSAGNMPSPSPSPSPSPPPSPPARGSSPEAPRGSATVPSGDAPIAGPVARETAQPTARRGDDGGAPTLSGTAPSGSLPVAVNRLAGAVPAITGAETLPTARESLVRASSSSSAVGVLERWSPDEAPVESELLQHSAVLPPRISRTWVGDEATEEPTALPLASLPRARRIARGASVAAPALVPGRRGESTDGRLHLGRRVIARSTDGRHLRWHGTDDAAHGATEASPIDGPHRLPTSTGATATMPAVTALPTVAPSTSTPSSSTPDTAALVRQPSAMDARIDQHTLETMLAGPATEAGTGAADTGEGRGAHDHILRRTLLAANEISATLGDLTVAPPPVGRLVPVTAKADAGAGPPGAVLARPIDRPSAGLPVPPAAAPRRDAAAPQEPAVADWVPAGPGTLFSATSTRGATVRRALLTMPEMLRSAAASAIESAPLPESARPDRAAAIHRGQVQRDLAAAGEDDMAAQHEALSREPRRDRAGTPVDHASTAGAALLDAPRSHEPLVDAGSLAVAPRAVQRLEEAPADTAPAALSGGSRPAVPARPAAPAELAERFLTELARHRQERPKPLPVQFASIADLIVGKRRPLVSTSEASQRALAAVDKVAATTGDVIHLAAPDALRRPTRDVTGIIAHELTHVAAPSPAPRFFADDRHSAEERRATEIGEIMRRSPAPPSGSIASRGGSNPMTITEQYTRSASTGAVTSSSTSSGGGRSDAIRRAMESAGSSAASRTSPTIQRALTDTATSSSSSASTSVGDTVPESNGDVISPEDFSRLLRKHFDVIVELLEDRIGSDIERRGGRYRGSF